MRILLCQDLELIDGAEPDDIMDLAVRAAGHAERERTGSSDGVFAQALRRTHAELRHCTELQFAEVATKFFPDDPLTIVPLAVTLATVMNSARTAILFAANVGGDSDSVASIAGAILGARYPGTIDDQWYAAVDAVNSHDLVSLADDLSKLRH